MNLGRAEDNVSVGETLTLVATTVPANSVVTWTSSDDEVATIVDGVVTGVSAGTATITAKITVDGVDYTDTCNIIVTE
ncbi:Ig-like domain-containing protein [Eubacterium ruminantium]|uniref:Ig-like domain-containing protein n=1 Tax=Eubacterium ruminantium TaxID=42322 RepID=UPI001FA6AAD5|nr:Ig-like domain-containing protein [Eubacterium ruminantium]